MILHGTTTLTWNQEVLKLIGSVKSPYPSETAFLDLDEERSLEKSVKSVSVASYQLSIVRTQGLTIGHYFLKDFANH